MWSHQQSTGKLFDGDGMLANAAVGGYSGRADPLTAEEAEAVATVFAKNGWPSPGNLLGLVGKNNPAAERIHAVGPLPRGSYRFRGPPFTHPKLGPYVLFIDPKPGTETYGRGDFRLHGDSVRRPGHGSDGCIIDSRSVRERIWASGDWDLVVVP